MRNRIVVVILMLAVLAFSGATSDARWMNPNTGRFWTMDAFEGRQTGPPSLHKYIYCQDNPVNKIDPTGMLAEDPEFAGVLNAQMSSWSAAGTTLGRSLAMSRIDAVMSQYAVNTLVGLGATVITVAGYEAASAYQTAQARAAVKTQVEQSKHTGEILFHYTDPMSAEQIVLTKTIIASPAKQFGGYTFPPGAYATDIPPWSTAYTQRQLSALFYGGNEGRPVSWFVAIEQQDFSPLIRPGFPKQYIRYAQPGAPVSVNVVAAGPNLMNK